MLKNQLTFQKMKIPQIQKYLKNLHEIPVFRNKRRLNAPCRKARAPGSCLGPLGLENLKSTGNSLNIKA
jgi:hypothetical protein